MPVEDKSKRVKRLPEDSMTTHLFSGNLRQKRCQSSHREHHTPTTQKEQLQTGIKVLTGMSVTNLALILVYLVNGEMTISFLYHNGSDRPISFPHPTPCRRQMSYLLPISIPPHKYHRQASHPEFLSNALSLAHHFLIVTPTLPTQTNACCIVCRFTYRNILARLVM